MRTIGVLAVLSLASLLPATSQADAGWFTAAAMAPEELADVSGDRSLGRAGGLTPMAAVSATDALETRVGTGSFYGQLLSQHSIRSIVDADELTAGGGFFDFLGLGGMPSD